MPQPDPPDTPDDDAKMPPEGTAQSDGLAAPHGTAAKDEPAHPLEPARPDGRVPPEAPALRTPAPTRDTTPPEATAYPTGSGIPVPTPPGSRGPGVGAGVGFGCLAHVIGVPVMLGSLASAMGIWGALWPFYLIAIAATVGMFFDATRRVSTGVLIVSAASWLVLLGPCVALVGGG